MSVTNIANALVTNLSAASVLGVAGKNYAVLEQTQDAAAVIGWKFLQDQSATFGGNKERLWTMLVEVFIKDTGSASAATDKFLTKMDAVVSSLESDETLQGTVQQIVRMRGGRTPGEIATVGTTAFLPFVVELDVIEWPTG